MLPQHLIEAIGNYIPKQEGWTTPERCCEMAELVCDTKPEMCVEIGVFAGRTLIAQAFGLRDNHKGCIYGIDPWKMDSAIEGQNNPNNDTWWKKLDLELFHQQTMKCIWDHRLDEYAVVIRARSQDCCHLFQNIDILNIDGCHSEVASCRDVRLYLPRVKSGGYIHFDDTSWETTSAAQAILEKECKIIKQGDNYKLYRKD